MLAAAEAEGFEILVTADKSLRHQQNIATRQIAIIELPTNQLRVVVTYAPQVNAALASILPGEYVAIPF